jgi:hypothetical protein
MDEMKAAMIVAARTWSGTSIVDGAFDVLRQVYSQHEHVGRAGGKCSRCGRAKSDPLHR